MYPSAYLPKRHMQEITLLAVPQKRTRPAANEGVQSLVYVSIFKISTCGDGQMKHSLYPLMKNSLFEMYKPPQEASYHKI